MIHQSALAALGLSGALAFVLLGVALSRSDADGGVEIAPIAIACAILAAPAVLLGISVTAVYMLVLATGVAVLARSRFSRAGQRGANILLSGIMGGLTVLFWLPPEAFATAQSAESLVMNGGLAVLAVAAAMAIFHDQRTRRRLAVAARPWALAAWSLLTLALLLGMVGSFALPSIPAAIGWSVASVTLHVIAVRGRRQRSLASAQQWGAAIAHGGVALALAGLIASLALAETRSLTLQEGQRGAIGPWLVQLNGITPAAGEGWVALEAELEASRGAGAQRLKPQQRYALGTAQPTAAVPAAHSLAVGRLGATLGPRQSDGGWPIRLTWRPFLGVVWAGLGLALIGAFTIAAARGWRWWRRRPETDFRRRSYA
ncbi:hypothetical protein H9L13_08335 [Sphingomonas lutea]|uniref:Cytochrome c-type biogenesis protein CcmF C-terminal domain-containing protein n=1 Tax=Sphingomonas lutea TaxID=1045317 RepID=A0A7G9SFS0_9SPHN|nr:cytochrome c-type biogenesis CcmF C-terminal domain-containing protein [Sphingomonas lutea]QNN66695.1 hypothetical protein H9L13_08335 [Sphingomonas lutea]